MFRFSSQVSLSASQTPAVEEVLFQQPLEENVVLRLMTALLFQMVESVLCV